ncbi:RNA polymerase III subunit Rpc25-domain-containing protein [Gorgonomyces haynaldii]|nr:RNA polymerase III subunit Rpc25-domain-containing protein [Gorgonomyces haynaldii]
MFSLCEIEDMVRIPPREFGKAPVMAIMDQLNIKYSNKIIHNVGLSIQVFEILTTTDFIVQQCQDGSFQSKVDFRLIVFCPFVGQILVGRILSNSPEGIHVTMDFFDDIMIPGEWLMENTNFDAAEDCFVWENDGDKFYYDIGQTIRFRVERVDFVDVPQKTPMKIWGACDAPALGLVEWWS